MSGFSKMGELRPFRSESSAAPHFTLPANPQARSIRALYTLAALYSSHGMATHLDKILATTRSAMDAAKALVPLKELEHLAASHQPRGWAAALRGQSASQRSESLSGPAVIAEIKKASPSKGLIRADLTAGSPSATSRAARRRFPC